MPNPLMRLGTPNRSQRPPERPQAIEPIPESIDAPVFPYRGTETHGVAPTEQFHDAPHYERDNTRDAYVHVLPEEHDPIPVKIVNEAKRELKTWQTRIVPVSTVPTMIASRNHQRTGLALRCVTPDAAAICYVSSRPETTDAINGYPVGGPQSWGELSLTTQDAVYAVVLGGTMTATTQVLVYVREDFTES